MLFIEIKLNGREDLGTYKYPKREHLITGCTFVSNEKELMEQSILNHIPYFDAMIVIDNSNDGTTQILNKYSALVIPQGNMQFHAGNFRNMMIDQSDTPWCWFFFPDELIETNMSVTEVRSMVKNGYGYDVLRLKRWNEMGPNGKDGFKYPDWQGNIVRLCVRYTLSVHEVPTYTTTHPIVMYDLLQEQIRIRHLFRPSDGDVRNIHRWDKYTSDIL